MKRVDTLLKRLWIRDLDGNQKSEIAENIIQEIDTGIEYRSQMILSVVIATLWLLVNATPVVIWAMLIAPILIPIQWVAFSISTWNRKLFFKALRLLVVSILMWVGIWMVLTWIIPLTEVTNEIAARTTPTLVDLWIASASWVIAFLAFGYKKIAAGLAWVAMAASLVPPLWVIGIWIAFGDMSIARGSTLLFLTNLVAIIISGIIIFYMFWFVPNQEDDLKRSVTNAWYVLIALFLLCIPLASSLFGIQQNNKTRKLIDNTIEQFLSIHHPSAKIIDIEYESNRSNLDINLALQIPQEQITTLTDEDKTSLTTEIVAATQQDVEMSIAITPVTTAYKEQIKEPTPQELVKLYIKNYIEEEGEEDIYVLDVDYYTDNSRIARIEIFNENNDLDKIDFRNWLFAYITSLNDIIDILTIDRQEHDQKPEANEAVDKDILFINSQFTSFFSDETQLLGTDIKNTILEWDDIEVDPTSPDVSKWPTKTIEITITTSLQPQDIRKKLANFKDNIQWYFADIINIKADIQYREEMDI